MIERIEDIVVVNNRLEIHPDVICVGNGPHIELIDLENDESVILWTKQEAEQVKEACENFLNSLDSWDWVAKDKEDTE